MSPLPKKAFAFLGTPQYRRGGNLPPDNGPMSELHAVQETRGSKCVSIWEKQSGGLFRSECIIPSSTESKPPPYGLQETKNNEKRTTHTGGPFLFAILSVFI